VKFNTIKKLLLLFIPLIFFFGCDDDENNNSNSTIGYNCAENGCLESASGQYATIEACESICDCFCGKILQIEEGNPSPWPGGWQYIPELSDSVYIEPYNGYQLFEIINYCSGNIAVGCYDWIIGSDPVSIDDTYCMEWSDYAWESELGCIADSIVPFNEF